MKKNNNMFNKYRWLLAIIVVIIFIYIFTWNKIPYNPPIEWIEYISWCKNMVLEKIISPSSAMFSDMIYTEWNTSIDPKVQYIILWKVDSQNSFGAMIRWEFICKKNWWEDMTVTISN